MKTTIFILTFFYFSIANSQSDVIHGYIPKGDLRWFYYKKSFQPDDTNVYKLKNGTWIDTNGIGYIFYFEIYNNLLNGKVIEIDRISNKVHSKATFIQGEATGLREYYIDDKISRKEILVKDELVESILYYSTGNEKQRVVSIKDTTGLSLLTQVTEYYPNGNIKSIGTKTLDGKNNLWNYWHLNGQRSEIGFYKYGKKIGKWSYYNEKGWIEKLEQFDDNGKLNGTIFID